MSTTTDELAAHETPDALADPRRTRRDGCARRHRPGDVPA